MSHQGAPRVTYIVGSYNHRRYVSQTLESIFAQTYQGPIEIIVCDDASTDGSRELFEGLAQTGRIRFLLNERNRGLVYSLNRAIEAATGDYMALIGSDDWIEPSKVAAQVDALERTGADGVLSPAWVVDESDGSREQQRLVGVKEAIAEGRYLERLYRGDSGLPLVQSGLFKLSAARDTGFLQNYKSDDWLFTIRFQQKGFRFGFLDEPLVNYRVHPGNAHKNAVRCLEELQLPVIRDFIPREYQRDALSAVYFTTALKLAPQSLSQAARFGAASLRQRPSAERLAILGAVALRHAPLGEQAFRALRRLARRVRAAHSEAGA